MQNEPVTKHIIMTSKIVREYAHRTNLVKETIPIVQLPYRELESSYHSVVIKELYSFDRDKEFEPHLSFPTV